MKNNLYLCSFASPDLEISKKRFIKQAQQMNLYKRIKIYGPEDLSSKKKKQIKRFFQNGNKRLFGYGCWKAEVIKSFLKKIPKNSILQYSDIGCHLNTKGFNRLKYYVNLSNKKNIITFKYKFPKIKKNNGYKYQKYYEYEYTKKDLISYLKISNNSYIFNSEQIMSGIIFFRNNNFTIKFLNEWEKILSKDQLIDDSNSKLKNHKKFIEHRHDQSAFSLICKKKRIFSLSASECEWAEKNSKRTWSHLNNFPIHARRDKKFNILRRFINRQKKNLRRILN